ncbi:helix-turn-helix domain-containing protein [Nocardia sp. NPDC023852]|uniref:helix-turn-helix domain-containing protein n=1 Tax=Nocardia sp. NPDC023852 TaxID=3154697 RepID=UPI0033F4F732
MTTPRCRQPRTDSAAQQLPLSRSCTRRPAAVRRGRPAPRWIATSWANAPLTGYVPPPGVAAGRPTAITDDQLDIARARHAGGESVTSIAAHHGVVRSTLYRALQPQKRPQRSPNRRTS